MLRTRIITAVVLLLLLVGALALGPPVFATFIAIAFGAAAFEWLRFAAWSTPAAVAGGVIGAIVLIALQWFGLDLTGSMLVAIAGATAFVWLVIAFWLAYAERNNRLVLNNGAIAALAPILLGGAWFSLLALYQHGALFLFSTLAVVWIADIAAYFAGRAFGKRKLAPHISPGKTWAGAVGAVVAVLMVGLAVWLGWPGGRTFSNSLFARAPLVAVLTLALLVVVSIVGDLFESLLKRHAGMKDSSGLLPGHGGVLDRIDALLPVLPAAVLIEGLL
ncbi:MAG TPA: phosphatidate cytidylyltransferase [Burkholderiaceae bacterium]|nr:phosphatidate cytidylyltransferase [Burkholderiaceae bacterium]